MFFQNENQVAIFIDYENIELSCQEKMGKDVDVDWTRVLDTAVDLGRVVVRRAYADWNVFSSNQRELLGMGVDLIHVTAKRGKNAADIRIVIDALEMVMGGHSNISHVMLVSGDGDFTELVHRLRERGKVVVGLGVSGASAEYLINACDQFIYYDLLVDTPAETEAKTPEEAQSIPFDISEGRQLLRRVPNLQGGEWVSAGKVKTAMLQINPAFNERNYNFASFKDFLAAQSDLVTIRTAQPGGHLEVQMRPESEGNGRLEVPEALLDRYLDILAQQKVRMTPTEHRPTIILKFYDIYKENKGASLTELKEMLHDHFEETAPNVKWQYVHETVHQLFHTYCFEFDQDDNKYPAETRLWDRELSMASDVKRASDLLDKCDKGLLMKIDRGLKQGEEIDVEVAARLLYGSVRGARMLDHVAELIEEL